MWCVHCAFAYGDFFDPMKIYHDKDCEDKFVGHIEDEVSQLYATFMQQHFIKLIDVLKREHKAAEKCHIFSKSLMNLRIER